MSPSLIFRGRWPLSHSQGYEVTYDDYVSQLALRRDSPVQDHGECHITLLARHKDLSRSEMTVAVPSDQAGPVRGTKEREAASQTKA